MRTLRPQPHKTEHRVSADVPLGKKRATRAVRYSVADHSLDSRSLTPCSERLQATIRSFIASFRPVFAEEHCQDLGPKRTEVGQDHTYVVPAATQEGVERVTERAFQFATR